MITGELKNKVDGIWDVFWAGGLTNPLDVIEQITYLMFIHDLDEADTRRSKESAMLGLPFESIFAGEVEVGDRTIDGTQLKWSVFHDFPAAKMYTTVQEWVFPFIKGLHSDKESAYAKYMGDAIFKVPTPLMLSKVVDKLDEIFADMSKSDNADVRGDVYEYLLNKIAQSGVNGQFRTPRHIIRMIVDLMQPKADDVICDPACGTSGFLISAGEYLKVNHKKEIFYDKAKKDHYMNHMFYGYDTDRTMLRIGAMNMMTHGVDNPFIEYRDSLSDQNQDKGKYSLILANPPFKGSLDYDIVSTDLLKVCKTKKTELLFLALFLRMLRVGSYAGLITAPPKGSNPVISNFMIILLSIDLGLRDNDPAFFYDLAIINKYVWFESNQIKVAACFLHSAKCDITAKSYMECPVGRFIFNIAVSLTFRQIVESYAELCSYIHTLILKALKVLLETLSIRSLLYFSDLSIPNLYTERFLDLADIPQRSVEDQCSRCFGFFYCDIYLDRSGRESSACFDIAVEESGVAVALVEAKICTELGCYVYDLTAVDISLYNIGDHLALLGIHLDEFKSEHRLAIVS